MVKFLRFFTYVGGIIFLLDRITKLIVLNVKPEIGIIPGFLSLTYATNTGISFGLLKSQPIIPTLVSIAVLIGIMYYYREIPKNYLVQTGTALLFAGTLGNLTDRLFYGFVIDFIDFSFWPAFNIADSAIVIGAVLLIIYSIKNEKN